MTSIFLRFSYDWSEQRTFTTANFSCYTDQLPLNKFKKYILKHQLKIKDSYQLIFTCLKSTIATLEKGVKYVQWRSGVFIVNSEHISHLFLLLLLE